MIKVLQVILALSILILVHEAGHFTFAKLFRIRVEKFYLFFDLGGTFLFSTKRSRWFVKLFPKALNWETEYGIGWLPLGGYCKIAGMIDESMDTEQLKREPQAWEFRTHNPWQRLLVMAGGVLYNFIFAVLIYIGIMAIWGQAYIENKDARIWPSRLAQEMGFRAGDEIISMDGYKPENFGMLQADLARRKVRKVDVLRGGDTLSLYMDQSQLPQILKGDMMFDLAIPFVVDSVIAGGANEGADLLQGDAVKAFGDSEVNYVQDAREVLLGYAGQSTRAKIIRGADTISVPLQVDSAGRIGVILRMPKAKSRKYSFLEAIPAGIKLTGETLGGYLRDLRLLAQPSTGAYKSVGSFIAVGQVFPSRWDWYQFCFLLALFSIMLGVMNLLPIPGLDGGHIVFTLYEILTGRKPSDGFMIVAQWIGMILLLALMLLAFGNDIGRLIH